MRALALSLVVLCCACAAAAPKPNVVLIVADDLGWGDPGCYGAGSLVPMPNIDGLAADGMRFTDAHSPSAVCTPTRYGILTGRYAWRTRLSSWVLNGTSPALIEPGRPTLASVLADAGYRTACFGKWHLGLGDGDATDYDVPLRPGPLEVGFERFGGIPASLDMPPYVWVSQDAPERAATDAVEASKQVRHGGAGFWRAGASAPGFRFDEVLPRIGREAVAYVEGADEPFFLYVPLTAPHTPWLPTGEFIGVSGAGAYGDFAAQVDGVVGGVLAALERRGLADDTIVVVTSDNGAHWAPGDVERFGHRANGSWRGQKADIHEGGHRVPLVVRWPRNVRMGSVCDETLCLTDLFPTLVAAVGATLPDGAAPDGHDALAWWTEAPRNSPLRDFTIHHSGDGMFAVRAGRWKLIERLGSGGFSAPRRVQPDPDEPPGQLYDLAADPAETTNVWNEHPDVVERLTGLLERARADA